VEDRGGLYKRGDRREIGEKVRTIVGGDFNARTGEKGGEVRGEGEEEEGRRKSRDKKVNAEGRVLLERIEELGWVIWNGGINGDEEGEWTYTGGRGESVIDYVLGEIETKEYVEKMEIGDQVDSDHHPVVIWIKDGKRAGYGSRKGGGRKRGTRRIAWSEEGKGKWVEEMQKGVSEEDREVEEEWENMKKRIRNVLEEGDVESVGNRGKGWWDEECKREKLKVRRELRRWREGGGCKEVYKERKKGYKVMCAKKKEEENRDWEEVVKKAKTVGQVWEVVNRERRKGRGGGSGIGIEEWESYFKKQLGGVDWKVVRGVRRLRGGEEEGVRREEIVRAVGKLRVGKAAGGDGIPAEVWKFGGESVID